MSGYWIIAMVAFVIFVSFFTTRVVGGKKNWSCDRFMFATEVISLASGIILLLFVLFAILYPINANIKYENMQKRIEYAESLACETETERFEHDYILAEAGQWKIDVKYNIEKFGIFAQYYSLKDRV